MKKFMSVLYTFTFALTFSLIQPIAESDSSPQNAFEWIMHYTSDMDNRARCLDGTPGVFYTSLAPSNSTNNDKWIFSFMWGGWCSLDVPIDWRDEHTVDHCYHRSFMYKGTTFGRESTNHVGERYYQVRDVEANPTFHDWNYVYIPYCDGTSFTGRRDDSLILDGPRGKREVFLRGAYIREAIAAMLLPMGLSNATVLVVSGTSAGGLATLMQADWWAENIVPEAKVLGLVDYGYFPSYTFDNSSDREVSPYVYQSNVTELPLQSYVDQIRLLYERSHAGVVHARCAQALGDLEAWRCMLGRDLAPYIRTPTFLLSSLYDSWQLENELGFVADAARVNAHGRRVYDDHMAFLQLSQPGPANPANPVNGAISEDGSPTPPGHGAFVHSCSAHLGQWFLDIDGTDMRTAVDRWVRWHLAGGRRGASGVQGPHSGDNGSGSGSGNSPQPLHPGDSMPPPAQALLPAVGASPAGGAGYMLWLQNRTYPCSECCEPAAAARRGLGQVTYQNGQWVWGGAAAAAGSAFRGGGRRAVPPEAVLVGKGELPLEAAAARAGEEREPPWRGAGVEPVESGR